MFEVKCYSLLDEEWEERDAEMTKLAGGKGQALFTASTGGPKTVDHTWLVKSFKQALALKAKLETVMGTRITIREGITS